MAPGDLMKTAKAKPEEKEEKLACSFCGSSRAKAFYVLCPTCIAAKEQGEINAVRQFIERVGVRYASPDDLEEQERQKDEILEMWHKAASVKVPDPRQSTIAALRLFVERVDIHFRVLGGNLHFSNALRRELAIMEKEAMEEETNARTND
jgi:hypothetical protein